MYLINNFIIHFKGTKAWKVLFFHVQGKILNRIYQVQKTDKTNLGQTEEIRKNIICMLNNYILFTETLTLNARIKKNSWQAKKKRNCFRKPNFEIAKKFNSQIWRWVSLADNLKCPFNTEYRLWVRSLKSAWTFWHYLYLR